MSVFYLWRLLKKPTAAVIRRQDEELTHVCAVGHFKHSHKPPMLLFFWSSFKNWKASPCNILWHKISFYTLQFTALNWRCSAWNTLSVICQGNVSSPALNPHLQAWAERCPRCSRAWCGPSLKTVKTLLLQQIDEVYLESEALRRLGIGEKHWDGERGERRKGLVMDFPFWRELVATWCSVDGWEEQGGNVRQTDTHHSASLYSENSAKALASFHRCLATNIMTLATVDQEIKAQRLSRIKQNSKPGSPWSYLVKQAGQEILITRKCLVVPRREAADICPFKNIFIS